MAIPSTPATPEQMRIESIKELDRMRNMSLQSIAMQRIRDSVITLSRETGFRERPMEQFTQAPLYIPQYQQWSNTLGKIVGVPPPEPFKYVPSERVAASMKLIEEYRSNPRKFGIFGANIPVGYASLYKQDLSSQRSAYNREYAAWQAAQRSLPT